MEFGEFIKDIKRKKELQDIPDSFILNRIDGYFIENKVLLGDNFNKKSSKYKKMFKEIRKDLHLVYGMFHNRHERGLEVYEKLITMLPPIRSIVDLGCGLAPLKYVKLFPGLKYCAYDLGGENIEKINEFFKKNKIRGKGFVCDLLTFNKYSKGDLCFIFSVLESLEYLERGVSKKILRRVNCKFIIVGFSKKVLGGKANIKKKGRAWFRKLLKEEGYVYEIKDIGDDIFFIIKK